MVGINKNRVVEQQLLAHFEQLPAVIIAPALGAIFTTWVLWTAVNREYLLIGLSAVLIISLIRLVLYYSYRRNKIDLKDPSWRNIIVYIALISGCVWGSAVIFLYPPEDPNYYIYMFVLLSLVPVAPLAAVAVYMPSFYAYYLPCMIPFVIFLMFQDTRAEVSTAFLLMMMMAATITFAQKYSETLTESIKLRLKLADQKASLELAAKMKAKFMASASHDIRQPVHTLGLSLESLRNKIDNSIAENILNTMDDSVASLRRMLSNFLDVSKLDADVVEINRVNFRLDDLLFNLCEQYRPLARKKGIELNYVPSSVIVNSDPILLERVLRNLLSNAIKYTEFGRVLLGCRRKTKSINVYIIDTGIGIAEKNLPEIFHEFIQVNKSASFGDYGFGLGLSIVDRICNLLGHGVSVESKLGFGSKFSVNIPVGVAVAAFQPSIMADGINLKDVSIALLDDDEIILHSMHDCLEQWGADVITGQDIKMLIEQYQAKKIHPDILIVDYNLGNGQTAKNAISYFKAAFEATEYLIITGDTNPELIVDAHQHGQLLLHKPIDPTQLKICIQGMMAKGKAKLPGLSSAL